VYKRQAFTRRSIFENGVKLAIGEGLFGRLRSGRININPTDIKICWRASWRSAFGEVYWVGWIKL